MGLLSSLVSNWTSSDAQVEADKLRRSASTGGFRAMGECAVGDVATIQGVVRSVTFEPSSRLPSLEAVVFDGSGTVAMVWLGRRRIVGIEPGRRIRATGRVCGSVTEPVLYNPRYTLLPTDTE